MTPFGKPVVPLEKGKTAKVLLESMPIERSCPIDPCNKEEKETALDDGSPGPSETIKCNPFISENISEIGSIKLFWPIKPLACVKLK